MNDMNPQEQAVYDAITRRTPAVSEPPEMPPELYKFQATARQLAKELMEAAQHNLTRADNMVKNVEVINTKLIQGMDAKAKEMSEHEKATDTAYERVQAAVKMLTDGAADE